jgi:purine-cytosine permease-like protein
MVAMILIGVLVGAIVLAILAVKGARRTGWTERPPR